MEQLSPKERLGIAALLFVIGLVIIFDLVNDYLSGGSIGHITVEALIALMALGGASTLMIQQRALRRENLTLRTDIEKIRESERRWKEESRRHVQGLSHAIDGQFERWHLTAAEKEVALLLLKGLSHKEVAAVRNTSERTIRQHSLAVYHKSGLGGRAELSAFFLEDLLSPREESRTETNLNP